MQFYLQSWLLSLNALLVTAAVFLLHRNWHLPHLSAPEGTVSPGNNSGQNMPAPPSGDKVGKIG